METPLSSGFWSKQIFYASEAWVILASLCILAFYAGFRIRGIRAKSETLKLRADAGAIESRLQLARELNIGDAKAINDIRTDIHKLRNMIGTDAQSNSLGPLIEDLDARTDTLALSNRTTDHILNAEKPAIGD
jgi:hypothetical protein